MCAVLVIHNLCLFIVWLIILLIFAVQQYREMRFIIMYLYGFAHVIFFNWNADIDFNAWSRCISSLHTSSYVRLLALSNIAVAGYSANISISHCIAGLVSI